MQTPNPPSHSPPQRIPPSQPELDAPDRDTWNARSWTLPGSILLGSLILGAFEPIALLAGAWALIWLANIHRSSAQNIQTLRAHSSGLGTTLQHARSLSNKLASVLDSADVPIIATDHTGMIILANRSAQHVLGSGRSLHGEHFESLITQRAVRELVLLAINGESGHARLELPVGGDLRVFDVATGPVPDTQGAVCTFTDITELSRSESLKADFAANASHELRTPIATILGAIQTIEGPAKDDPAMVQRLISMISINASRLDSMVKDLLDLSKLESTSIPTVLSKVDLRELIERTSAQFAQVCDRRRVTIKSSIESQISWITTDESLLLLILRNLIENAVKFAHEGTAVTIHAESIELAPDPENPPPAGLNGTLGVRIGVRDEGIGIPLSQQTRIFERFYQVDETRDGSSARRGTGLGLAIVKHAARTLGGKIRLKSIHQQGTTMIVELPHCAEEIAD